MNLLRSHLVHGLVSFNKCLYLDFAGILHSKPDRKKLFDSL